MNTVTAVKVVERLVGLEAGLQAELAVLRQNRAQAIEEDAREPYEFEASDALLAQLIQTKSVLQAEVARKKRSVLTRRSVVRDLVAARRSHESDPALLQAPLSEDDLKKQVLSLRRDTLSFAKEQFPLSQDEDFEGGDFWDACVAACSDPDQPIEYSDREAGFAELLLQSGVVDRLEDVAGVKRIRLARELFILPEEDEEPS